MQASRTACRRSHARIQVYLQEGLRALASTSTGGSRCAPVSPPYSLLDGRNPAVLTVLCLSVNFL